MFTVPARFPATLVISALVGALLLVLPDAGAVTGSSPERVGHGGECQREPFANSSIDSERNGRHARSLTGRDRAPTAASRVDKTGPIATIIVGAAMVVGALPFHLWSFDASEEMDSYDAVPARGRRAEGRHPMYVQLLRRGEVARGVLRSQQHLP